MYTVLTGGYEDLREQPVAPESELDFVAFTDFDVESETWDVRRFDPVFPADPRRSQNVVRLLPHKWLPDYDLSIYVDNTRTFKQPPEALLDLLPGSFEFAASPHRRRCVAEEFHAVARLGFAPAAILREQWAHYRRWHPEVLERPFFEGSLMVRRHHRPAVIAAMEHWLFHVLRYSARNQLSGQLALDQVGLAWHALPCSAHEENEYVGRPDRSSRAPRRHRVDVGEGFEFDPDGAVE